MLVEGARGLDRAFDRFGTRIGEEHRIGEGLVDQHLREAFALRAAVEVGDVHQRLGLFLDRADQPLVAVTEQVDRNAAREVEIARAVFVDQVAVLTLDRADVATGIDGHQGGDRHGNSEKFKPGNDKWRPREGTAIRE